MKPAVSAACACSAEDIARLPDAELLALADAVSDEVGGDPIVKATDRELALELALARDLDEDFRGDLEDSVDAELTGLDEAENAADEVGAAVEGVSRRMRERSMAGALSVLTASLGAIATVGRRVVRTQLIDRGFLSARGTAPGGIRVAASLSQVDEAAVARLAGNQTFWIGEFWSKHLSARVAATVRREALERGLGRAEVGRILRGVVSGEFPGVSVPGTYRGSSESYFRMLAGTVRNHASTFGALTGLEQAGFDRYRIVAVMDERTSEVCRTMNGRTFSVPTGLKQMNETVLAEDPEELKAAAGWKSAEAVRQAAGDGDARSQEHGLAAAGLALPPYHGSCRTVISPE